MNMRRIASGNAKKKAGKMYLQSCRFRGGFARDSRGCSQKCGNKSKIFRRSTIEFHLTIKFAKSCVGPPPVLSEGEENL